MGGDSVVTGAPFQQRQITGRHLPVTSVWINVAGLLRIDEQLRPGAGAEAGGRAPGGEGGAAVPRQPV